ncbi:MAG: CsbD family protein [Hyphomicrobiales bacterium]|nr:CsbD family protein [Hyphomicrobiales bacterium]
MDKEHLKGAANKIKGTAKDAAGKALGDKKMQAEGKFDKAKGAAHNVAGDAKEAARQANRR